MATPSPHAPQLPNSPTGIGTGTGTGTELCKKNTISTEAAFAVAVIHASLAEGRTGRGVTASRETIANRAEVSVSVVKRARRVLGAWV
ncbi:hypothetical protein [Rhodococcus globerulus]|jgi:hypothetical protein|uniref:hypothetical protein n=1 Tax=Rhodococcus globerulus TaxID=33008 RepID=UPI001F30D069|nr:hypothetical protein [Rhodococcus globerulus]MCE4267715.1 hypothetical protein [Rhodococcus globerulus]